MIGLTIRQKQVLDFIKKYISINKYPPTIREIGDNFGISVKGGYDHIKALEKKKYIKCHENRSRTIEILNVDIDTSEVNTVPLLGRVAAGRPLFAEENFEGIVKIPCEYLGNGRYFALNIVGSSMKEAGIIDGDIAVIRHQENAENGDIVVAMVDEEAVTIKRIFKNANVIELRPENSEFHPIFSQNVRVLGKLICLIRKYES